MRYLVIAPLFLLMSVALYNRAPWQVQHPSSQEEVSVSLMSQSETVSEFAPPKLSPSAYAPCAYCSTNSPAKASRSQTVLTGMEWECADCGTIHLGPLSY